MSNIHQPPIHSNNRSAHGPAVQSITPEFFPIPQRGQDPHFGLGRSSYYNLENEGIIKLVRIRKPGQIRGKVLVPYAETRAALRKLGGLN